MNSKRNNMIFIVVIGIICVVTFFGAMFIRNGGNPFSKIINTLDGSKNLDNLNGIYRYKESLDGTFPLFQNCTISSFDNYISIVNDEYYMYRSSCIGTFIVGSGKVKDLDIKDTEDKTSYFISYDGNKYVKDFSKSIVVENRAAKMSEIRIENYPLLIKESQRKGGYYNIKQVPIANYYELKFSLKNVIDDKFVLSLVNSRNEVAYQFDINDFEQLPNMYIIGRNLVVVEKNETAFKYRHNFIVLTDDKEIFRLEDALPITVDGYTIDKDASIFIKYNQVSKDFTVLFGKDKDMCVNKSDSNDITYYEFKLKYNYYNKSFDKPLFQKIGRKSEGCDYVNSIIGG